MRELKRRNNVFDCSSINGDSISTRRHFSKNQSGLNDIPRTSTNAAVCFNNTLCKSFGITADEISRKVLLMGDSGEGKTNTFYQLFEQVSEMPNSVNIIFDSKGDFYKRFGGKEHDCIIEGFTYHTGNSLSAIGNSVHDMDVQKTSVKIWNVFEEILTDENPKAISREIAKILNNDSINDNRQVFFKKSAVTLIETAMSVLCNDYYVKGVKPSNKLLVDFLRLSPEAILKRAKEYDLESEITELIAPAKDGVYNGQTLGVMGEVNNIVSDLFVGNFADIGNFSIRQAIRNRQFKNIFIEYDITYGKTLSPIYSCLIMLAIKEAMGRYNTPRVNLFIDEFALLDYIPDMEAAVSFGREQGLFIAASLQHIGQVRSKYTKDIADGMLNNFRNLIAFKCSDYDTREFIKNRFGQQYKFHTIYRSLSERISLNNLETTVSDEDILSLRRGEAIISTADSNSCFKFQFKNIKDGE